MRDDAVLGRALPLDRGLGPTLHVHYIIDQLCTLDVYVQYFLFKCC